MRESQNDPNSGDQQQQTGESTNSPLEDIVNNDQDIMEEERILRTMANFLSLLADDPGTLLENNRSSDETFDVTEIGAEIRTRRQSGRRKRTHLSPGMNMGNMRNSTTPEREIPRSQEQTTENALLPSLMMGTITPDCPAPTLVEISPNPDFELNVTYPQQRGNETAELVHEKDQYRRSRSWAKQKLAAVIFSHPQPLRNFCLEAYEAARERSLNNNTTKEDNPTDAPKKPTHNKYLDERITYVTKIPRVILYENIPFSITLDTWNVVQEMTLDASFATIRITVMVLDASAHVVMNVLGGVTRFNPLIFANGIITRPFNMMGMTTEVVVSGIQSVATGVGSASSIALNRFSAKNRSPSSTGLVGSQGNLRRVRSPVKKTINQKLLRKLNNLNSAAPVVFYTELGDNNGGLSKHAKSRVQRMMHYDVSLRPFVATVKLQESFKKDYSRNESFYDDADADSESSSPLEGPFMCTPQSFPPTPASRAHVLKRGSRFADDVVFLARDQLRVYDGLESSNERTREMAQALTQGKRLAVFDAADCSGIDLSCGQHVATKVGNILYCSSRSMVPILRNCFVYFEMTVLGRSGGVLQTSMATLSFGLSTKEMPSTTLVGVWKGSVGLCTTGQILISGQWCSLGPDPTISPFGDRETVGCLVCLDDNSAFETWDGVMITATVTFNINGRIVSPRVPSAPISGPDQGSFASTQTNVPIEDVPPLFTLPLLVPAEEELYPTLTLHSPGTSVMCRFSAGDITARSRDAIGAPKNVTVYAVDGSIVFNGE